MQLGNIEIIDPKSLGIHEEHQFTPWLLQNLDKLGDELGIEIDPDNRQREVMIGRYIADIVAQETVTGRKIIIENQLWPSDHKHLGQLLTYAAGGSGAIIVWVCHELRDEHRQVLDWLNGQVKGVGFFGVEFEVIKIDNSNPAFRFVSVVRPSEWENATPMSHGDRAERYRPFFQHIVDELRDRHHFTSVRVAQEQRWVNFAAGHTGLSYNAAFAGQDTFQIEMYMQTKSAATNKAIFDGLDAYKEEIQQQLGTALKWERGDGKQFARISLGMSGNIDDKDKHAAMQAWGIEWLLKFKKVFGTYLPTIVAEVRDRIEENA